MAKVRKTDPCPCGSEKKYKYCHGAKQPEASTAPPARRQVFLWIVVALAPIAYAATFFQGDPEATAVERVWSEEHGHYHNVDGSELDAETPAEPATPGEAPGPPPPGKVWSEEHGHWHDADEGTEPAGYAPPSDTLIDGGYRLRRPEGPAPEGKYWSEEHGHWHDNDSP